MSEEKKSTKRGGDGRGLQRSQKNPTDSDTAEQKWMLGETHRVDKPGLMGPAHKIEWASLVGQEEKVHRGMN